MASDVLQSQRFSELLQWYEALRQGDGRSLRIYALMDGALDEDIFRVVNQREAAWRSLYRETMLEAASPAFGPYLVALTPEEPEHAALMKLLLRRAQDTNLVIWVVSRQRLTELAAYLHQYAEVGLPDGRRGLFRYYDSSILETLLRVFTQEQHEQFLVPFRELRYWREEWQTVVGMDLAVLPPVSEGGMTLTVEQQNRLAMATLAETFYHEIRKRSLAPGSDVDKRVHVEQLRNLIDRAAQRYLLNKQDELMLFALVGLKINRTFDAHPAVAASLDPRQRGDMPLRDVFSSLAENVWDELLVAANLHPVSDR